MSNEFLSKLSANGNGLGRYVLALSHFFGEGNVLSRPAAMIQFQSSAFLGNNAASYFMGHMYLNGLGVEKDYRKAAKLFSLSAQATLHEAEYAGETYVRHGVTVSDSEASHEWYGEVLRMALKDIEEGSGEEFFLIRKEDEGEIVSPLPPWNNLLFTRVRADSRYELGIMHSRGMGVPKDTLEAIECLRVSARFGNPMAEEILKELLTPSRRMSNPSERKRLADWLYNKAWAGHLDFQHDLAILHLQGKVKSPSYDDALIFLHRSAELGHRKAILRLGNLFREGTIYKKDVPQALDMFHFAAIVGSDEAYLKMGEIWESGEAGKGPNLKEADSLYRTASSMGLAEASLLLGNRELLNKKNPNSKKEAIDLFLLAAEQGSSEADYRLGLLYLGSDPTLNDLQKALFHLERAAERRHPEARLDLAEIFLNGSSEVKDPQKAVKILKDGVAYGDPKASFLLGNLYEEGKFVPKDLHKANTLYHFAASKGLSRARYRLGFMLETGLGVNKDSKKALDWLKTAAKDGHPESLSILNALDRKENKSPEDLTLTWLSVASENGDPKAQLLLGMMLETGSGLKRDLSKAVEHYKASSAQGNPDAMRNLADMLFLGIGVPRDREKARLLYGSAAEMGHEAASAALILILESGLGVPADRKEALRLRREALKRMIEKDDLEGVWQKDERG
jgi:TPR repeat protein